jgi:hypothetical protein
MHPSSWEVGSCIGIVSFVQRQLRCLYGNEVFVNDIWLVILIFFQGQMWHKISMYLTNEQNMLESCLRQTSLAWFIVCLWQTLKHIRLIYKLQRKRFYNLGPRPYRWPHDVTFNSLNELFQSIDRGEDKRAMKVFFSQKCFGEKENNLNN